MSKESKVYCTEINTIRQQRKDGISTLRCLTETVTISLIKLKQDKLLAEKKRVETNKKLHQGKEVKNVLDAASESYKSEIISLKDEVKQLTEESIKLKETVCNLTAETTMLKFALGNMEGDRVQLRQAINDELNEKKSLTEELARIKQEMKQTNENNGINSEKEEKHRIELQLNIDEKNAVVSKLKIQLTKIKEMTLNKDNEIHRQKEDLCHALSDLDCKRQENAQDKLKILELREINEKNTADISSFKARLSMLEGVNQSLTDTIASKEVAEKEVHRLNEELLRCKTKKRWIAKEHAGNVEELNKCKPIIENMQMKIDKLSADKISQSDLIGELKEHVTERDRWLAEEHKKNDLKRMKFKEKEKNNKETIDKLYKEIDACRSEIKDKSREILCLREKQIESYINQRDFEQWKQKQLISDNNNNNNNNNNDNNK